MKDLILKPAISGITLAAALSMPMPAFAQSDDADTVGNTSLGAEMEIGGDAAGNAETDNAGAEVEAGNEVYTDAGTAEQIDALETPDTQTSAETEVGLVLGNSFDPTQVAIVDIGEVLDERGRGELSNTLSTNAQALANLRAGVAAHAALSDVLDRQNVDNDDVIGLKVDPSGLTTVFVSTAPIIAGCSDINPIGDEADREDVMNANNALIIELSNCAPATIDARFGGSVTAVSENDALIEDLQARGYEPADVVGVNDLAGRTVSLYVVQSS